MSRTRPQSRFMNAGERSPRGRRKLVDYYAPGYAPSPPEIGLQTATGEPIAERGNNPRNDRRKHGPADRIVAERRPQQIAQATNAERSQAVAQYVQYEEQDGGSLCTHSEGHESLRH